eukprot:826395-Amorphochlora_amoeboformis.AAC.1
MLYATIPGALSSLGGTCELTIRSRKDVSQPKGYLDSEGLSLIRGYQTCKTSQDDTRWRCKTAIAWYALSIGLRGCANECDGDTMGGQGESKILVLGLGCTENTNLPIRRRIVVMLMLLLLCMVLVYAIVVVKLGDQGYILAGLVLMVCVVTTLLVPLRLAERRREQQMPYEQIPQHIFAAGGQQRQGSDYLLGVSLRHLRLILREGDFDANGKHRSV